jgi:hypothetical protein
MNNRLMFKLGIVTAFLLLIATTVVCGYRATSMKQKLSEDARFKVISCQKISVVPLGSSYYIQVVEDTSNRQRYLLTVTLYGVGITPMANDKKGE